MLADAQAKAEKEVLAQMRVVNSPRYCAVFPNITMLGRTENVKQSARGFTLASKDGDKSDFNIFSREPTVEGYAVGSQINGSGYDMIIADDIVLPEARSQDWYRNDTNRRWEEVIRQRLRNPVIAEIKIVATPWHQDDVYGRIEKRKGETGSKRWKIVKFPILQDDSGLEIPIWPSRYTREMLEEEKATSRPDRYACLFRLDSRHDTTQAVKRLHFYNAQDDELTTEADRRLVKRLETAERWLSIDMSGSSGKDAADNGVIEIALSPRGFAFVTHCWELRMAPVAFREWVMAQINNASGIGYAGIQVEGQGSQAGHAELFLDDIRKMLAEQDKQHTLSLIVTNARVGRANSNQSKMQRLQASAMLMETARVKFAGYRYTKPTVGGTCIRAAPNTSMALLVEAIRNFNTTTHKDIVDALTQFLLHNRERIASATVEEEQAEAGAPVGRMTELLKKQLKEMQEYKDSRYDDEAQFLHAWAS